MNTKIEVKFFNEDHDLKLDEHYIHAIIIKDGFLKLYDVSDGTWHCFNINNIKSFSYPDIMYDKKTGIHKRPISEEFQKMIDE